MTAVFKKDFASLFHGFIGWLFLAVMWGILSLYIGMSSFIGLDPDITAVLAVSSVIMIVMLPILSMRSFAEERKTRTDQMILTAPVSIGQVVLGKYLALAAVHSIVDFACTRFFFPALERFRLHRATQDFWACGCSDLRSLLSAFFSRVLRKM